MEIRSAFSQIPPGTNIPLVVNAIVELPKGRRRKFEVDKQTGLIKLDRYLYSSSHYPGDYGLPSTIPFEAVNRISTVATGLNVEATFQDRMRRE